MSENNKILKTLPEQVHDESHWDNFDNFINDFAINNESVSEENSETEQNPKSHDALKTISTTEHRKDISRASDSTSPEGIRMLADLTHKMKMETESGSTTRQSGLQNDIRNLLVELQEIKKARLDLQSKLDSIR